ncbi:AbrB family transcriptional regulator [Geothermobacter ehrlichii]|uniref:AbrB family transcriptional regulator n=1 Tax=Geothermobacter ehrlichii TaxID=213224 RepID=A0A5D3WIA1_9BACT|nr:AbrB/MazE/SpoVT family DNA-binding domain-containing protein [Geothermobacter ehrlichii]TYO96808.1 AbrB family transcriptional regulator [Geothermobacter ehrlichii]
MKVTVKGRVTISRRVREKLGIRASEEVEFIEERGRVYIVKSESRRQKKGKFAQMRGTATAKMSTEDIMGLTRRDM